MLAKPNFQLKFRTDSGAGPGWKLESWGKLNKLFKTPASCPVLLYRVWSWDTWIEPFSGCLINLSSSVVDQKARLSSLKLHQDENFKSLMNSGQNDSFYFSSILYSNSNTIHSQYFLSGQKSETIAVLCYSKWAATIISPFPTILKT